LHAYINAQGQPWPRSFTKWSILEYSTMTTTYYGPVVVSNITHYANVNDLKALLQRKFPPTAAQPEPWSYTVSRLAYRDQIGRDQTRNWTDGSEERPIR
jgi:hypothetical protein